MWKRLEVNDQVSPTPTTAAKLGLFQLQRGYPPKASAPQALPWRPPWTLRLKSNDVDNGVDVKNALD